MIPIAKLPTLRLLWALLLIGSPIHLAAAQNEAPADGPVKLAVFDVDATPPVGSEMAYDPVKRIDELSLRCRGIVRVNA